MDIKLTKRQQDIYDVLGPQWMSASVLAAQAGIRNMSPRESASRMADKLVELGLAEKGGRRQTPQWRRKQND